MAKRVPIDTVLKERDTYAYSVYAALYLYGSLLLFFGCFGLLLELTTRPRLSPANAIVALVASAISLGHLLLESRSTKPRSLWRWLLFSGSVGLLAYEPFKIPGVDRAGAIMLSSVLATGAGLIGVARLLLVPHLEAFVSWPLTLRFALSWVAFLWPVAVGMVLKAIL